MKDYKIGLFDVASILRKHHLHRLNYKQYSKFTKKDFESINHLKETGVMRPEDYTSSEKRTYKLINVISPDGEKIEYKGVSDICDSLEINAKNYWRKFAEKKGYTIVSVEDVLITQI